jgi:NTE family protein
MAKTALVLSAGGMLGAYQAGVWKELSHRLEPDLVIGSSVGALNGWMIAAGADPDDLIAQWLDPSTSTLMRLRFPWPPWSGIFRPQPLAARVTELYERRRPRVPFAVVLVEVPRLRLHLARDGNITAAHLLATCSMPGGFPAVHLAGHTFVDGGFLSVLPLWAAERMGAERAVAIHALPVMPSLAVRWTVSAFRKLAGPPPVLDRLDVRTIALAGAGRRLREFLFWDRRRIQALIDLGRQHGRAAHLFDE